MNDLVLDDVTFGYTDTPVVRNLSATFPQGEITLLSGRSGTGKSTILGLSAGILQPQSGRVSTSNYIPGFVFQSHGLFPWMTAIENVRIALKVLGTKQSRDEIAQYWLDQVGLSGKCLSVAGELSGGEKRRLQLARLFASSATLWLLDEPFAGLDISSKSICLNLLMTQFKKGHATAIIVSHTLEDICDIGTRFYWASHETGSTVIADLTRHKGKPVPEIRSVLLDLLSSSENQRGRASA